MSISYLILSYLFLEKDLAMGTCGDACAGAPVRCVHTPSSCTKGVRGGPGDIYRTYISRLCAGAPMRRAPGALYTHPVFVHEGCRKIGEIYPFRNFSVKNRDNDRV